MQQFSNLTHGQIQYIRQPIHNHHHHHHHIFISDTWSIVSKRKRKKIHKHIKHTKHTRENDREREKVIEYNNKKRKKHVIKITTEKMLQTADPTPNTATVQVSNTINTQQLRERQR